MFDETINRQQLLDDLSIQVGRIKARLEKIKNSVRNRNCNRVAIKPVTSDSSNSVSNNDAF